MEVSGSGNIQPLPKKEKGFTMSYGHYNSRVHNTVYISYKNNKLYLSNYIRNSSQLACKFTFLNQKPIKILDWHKLEIMSSEIKDKKIKIQCTGSSEEDNDYNKVLAKEIWGE
ncbi:MAG: hypothetical protein KN64_11745 [Sulfurovum sp. AS07-7]|nr:MAG: hypothetical protein KN64_11745 [Sulfurovum sp. AS07-7]